MAHFFKKRKGELLELLCCGSVGRAIASNGADPITVIFYIEHICCRQRLKRQKEVGNGPLFKLLEDKAFSATALGLIWRLHHEFVLRLKIIVSVH